MRKASCHHEKLKMSDSGKKKLKKSISSIKRVTGKFLEVSHRAWSSKTRANKCTTKCAARASRFHHA